MKRTGKMKNSSGKRIIGLDAQDAADSNAVGVRLHHGLHEAAQLGEVSALGQSEVRLTAAPSHLHVLQGADELLRQRPLAVLAGAGHSAFEAETRFHRNQHLVQCIGELQLHGLLPFLALAVEHQVGYEVPQKQDEDAHQLDNRRRPDGAQPQPDHATDEA
jgi:hypothetical protein